MFNQNILGIFELKYIRNILKNRKFKSIIKEKRSDAGENRTCFCVKKANDKSGLSKNDSIMVKAKSYRV